ncbi:LPXTG cell wall anchor domain-containing protein [Lactobacillus amylolyticus]|uniref:LPXTG cell wall anchor domain-containing protein n=1 Tax=Lactobacillus amylolyticus TaxID=83683 RepID=UPI0013E0BC80|nr:LPXTG cell wall anchor domain-containing protein [Lactobacillus amylolyticus]
MLQRLKKLSKNNGAKNVKPKATKVAKCGGQMAPVALANAKVGKKAPAAEVLAAKKDAKTLPQTGEKKSAAAIISATLGLIGLICLAGASRKKLSHLNNKKHSKLNSELTIRRDS